MNQTARPSNLQPSLDGRPAREPFMISLNSVVCRVARTFVRPAGNRGDIRR